MTSPVFSQPSSDGSDDDNGPSSTLISMAAQLAHTLGQRDQIRDQLPENLRGLFDVSYPVQDLKRQAEGLDKKWEADQRLEAETARLRASRGAAEHLAAEEEAALRSAAETDAGDFGDVLTSLDLEGLPEADPLIEGFLNEESVVRLHGPPKSYKSFVMLDMAGCVGAGIPWMGKKVTAGKVLYIVAEGVRGIRRRVRAWKKQNNRPMTGVDFFPKSVQLTSSCTVSGETSRLGWLIMVEWWGP